MLINIGINRNKSCIWIKVPIDGECSVLGLIETRVVFELVTIIFVSVALGRLIETRVVFESIGMCSYCPMWSRLIETRVVFEWPITTQC